MSIHRTAAKRDANEAVIIAALRAAGCSVQQLSIKGAPDLLIGYQGQNFLLEVKMPKGKLTPDEKEWQDSWEGQVDIIRSVEEALEVIGRMVCY